MSAPLTHPHPLDHAGRQAVIALLRNGSSRRIAARYLGCAPSTITRTAARDPAFAAQLVQAEQSAEIHLLRSVQAAAKEMKYWRAAAWLLERRNAEDFGLRPPQLFTSRQVVELFARVAEILRGDLPEENCRRAIQKLDDLIAEFATADQPLLVSPPAAAPEVVPEEPPPEGDAPDR